MQSSNTQIAKNSLFLYVRMLVVMLVSLYTARVVLNVLGVEDYGVYNVVAGVVSTFSFLTGTISAATSRFFAFELGRRNEDRLSKYFRLSMLSFFVITFLIIVLAETVGLWFLYNKMIIPADKMSSAVWVYQFAILAFVVNMLAIPYNAIIVARENMQVYAYIGILEVILKLVIVYFLSIGNFEKLKFYAILMFIVSFIVSFLYYIYCKKKYKESHFSFFWDKKMFNEFFSFSFWILFGSFSSVARGQGLNIVLNMFFGPIVNAAYGVSYQVNNAINQFVNSFYTAVRPQITKRYAAGEITSMMKLVFVSSRMCYFLVLIFAIPLFLETPLILKLWLINVPDYSVIFLRLVILVSLIDAGSYPFQAAVSSTGKVKWYQIITGGLMIVTLFVAYFALKLGLPPAAVFYISIVTTILAQISRIIFMRFLLGMSIKDYSKDVLAPIFMVTILACLFPVLCYVYIEPNLVRLIITSLVSVVSTVGLIFIFGINRDERLLILNYIKGKK